MQITELRIDDRSKLCAVRTNKFKRNSLFLTRVLDIDPETTPCDVVLCRVLGRQTVDSPSSAALSRRCEELYGAEPDCFVNFLGDKLIMVLYADFVSDSVMGGGDGIIRGTMSLLASIWRAPVLDKTGLFPADEVARARQGVCNDIRSSENDPGAYASRKCRELTCAGYPQGYSVKVDDVDRVTPERLTERYRELLSGSFGAFYVGDSPELVAKLLPAYFGAGCVGGFTPLNPRPVLTHGGVQRVDEVRRVGQGKLCMAFHGAALMQNKDDYYATLMSVEVFGGSPVAKLFMNVRERLGLCYHCSAVYNKLGGIIYVSSGVAPENRERAEREILAQLDELQKGNITDAELRAARLSLINSARQIEDNPYSVWSFSEHRLRLGLDCSLERHIERIGRVTAAEIQRATASWTLGVEFFLHPDGECADVSDGGDDETCGNEEGEYED